jgi:hypothetical protein
MVERVANVNLRFVPALQGAHHVRRLALRTVKRAG